VRASVSPKCSPCHQRTKTGNHKSEEIDIEGKSPQPESSGYSLNKDGAAARAAVGINRAFWLYSLLVISTTAWAWFVYSRYPFFDFRPLFRLSDRFSDLTLYRYKATHLSDGAAALAHGLPLFTYPAPAAYVYAFFFKFGDHAVQAYLSFVAFCAAGFAIITWRAGAAGTRPHRLGAAAAIATTSLLGYPLWFVADRGNIEIVVWAFSATGLCLLLRGKYPSAAILLGIASAIKPFPALFFFLLLRRRRFREAILGVSTAGVLLLASLVGLGPNPVQAYRELQPGVARYVAGQVVTLGWANEARFEHSLLDGMKSAALIREMGGVHPISAVRETERVTLAPGGWKTPRTLAKIYPYIVLICLGLLVAIFFKMPILNQLTAAAVAVTLFPYVSADYTLLHLLVPFGALLVFLVREVGSGRIEFPSDAMQAFLMIYAFLFAPLTFLRIYAGDAKLLLLLALLFVAAKAPMRSEYFGDSERPKLIRPS
jgi:hypothetical protein